MARNHNGFTLIEIVVVVAVVAVLAAVAIGALPLFQKRSTLSTAFNEFENVLKEAKSQTLFAENNSQYGVYLNTAAAPHQYVLFKGINYESREKSADKTYSLPESIEFYNIDFSGGKEVVFERITGKTSQAGAVSLRLKNDNNINKTLYVSKEGIVGEGSESAGLDKNRVKDSRHIIFDYSRTINVASETITLNFNNSEKIEQISITDNLNGGQIDWEGVIDVGGKKQTLKIHTLKLNDSGTSFSIHRDRRLNDKSLKINLSGDSTGELASYSADGLTTNYSSIYVSNFVWQ